MRALDLSHPLEPGMPVYPGDPKTDIRTAATVKEDGFASAWLGLPSHAGTHVDVAAHMLADGTDVDALSPEAFIGTGVMIHAPKGAIGPEVLEGQNEADFILLRTGWDRLWGTPGYYKDHPHLLPETAEALARLARKGVGMDFPSPDPMGRTEAHELFFGAGLVIIENLRGLEALAETIFTFSCLPLKLTGGGGGPCRAVGILP